MIKLFKFIYRLILIVIFSLSINCVFGQGEKENVNIEGTWKVMKWMPLVRDVILNNVDRKYFKEDSLSCLKSVVIINKRNGIRIRPLGNCDFDDFENEANFDSTAILKVIPEDDLSLQHPGLEIENGQISKTITEKLGFNNKYMKMIITNYSIDWGNGNKLKILIIDANKIAFFLGGIIVVLKKLN